MDRFFIVLFALSFQSLFASVRPVLTREVPKVRVRIADSLGAVSISGTDLERVFHRSNKKKVFPGRKRVRFNCTNFSRKRNKHMSGVLLASLSSPTGLISLKKSKYRGSLHVMTSEKNESCDVINEVGMEEYISSLLAKEMNAKWEIEALKAQAVAARTYAMSKIKKSVTHYDLESSEKDQVSGTFSDITKKTSRAARETKGLVLLGNKGSLKPIFFHAKCGGRTLRPDQVWTNRVVEYKNIKCPFCHDHGKKNWNSKLSRKRLFKFINWLSKNNFINGNIKLNSKTNFFIAPDNMKHFKMRIYVDDKLYVLNKSLMRRYFGRVLFKSNNFKLVPDNKKGYAVYGQGHGHGVGMCQLGALDLAKKGWGFKKILAYYFPKHKLTRFY